MPSPSIGHAAAARARARHRPGAADRPLETASGRRSRRSRAIRRRSRRSGREDRASSCPRSSARCAGPSCAAIARRRRGDGLRLALGRRPPALPGRRPPRARPVGLLDGARRAGRRDDASRARPARRVHRVPPAGAARPRGCRGGRGQRRAAPGRARLPAGTRPSSARSGCPFDRRVARFEEAFEIIRRLLAGERVTLRRARSTRSTTQSSCRRPRARRR